MGDGDDEGSSEGDRVDDSACKCEYDGYIDNIGDFDGNGESFEVCDCDFKCNCDDNFNDSKSLL